MLGFVPQPNLRLSLTEPYCFMDDRKTGVRANFSSLQILVLISALAIAFFIAKNPTLIELKRAYSIDVQPLIHLHSAILSGNDKFLATSQPKSFMNHLQSLTTLFLRNNTANFDF